MEEMGAITQRAAVGNRREDYKRERRRWNFFPHDHSRSRAYRWGEAASPAFPPTNCACASRWPCGSGKDPILKNGSSA